MLKKSLLVLLVLVCSVALITGCAGGGTDTGTATGTDTAAKEVVKVGYIAPLTGGDAAEGAAARNAYEMAFEELNESGELPYTVEVESMDDASTPETGASAAQKLVAEEGMIALCGFWNSGVAETVIPICDQAGVPLVIWGCMKSSLTDGSHYPTVTRTCPTAEQENIPLAEKVFGDLGYKKVFIVSVINPYGEANTNAITAEAQKHGVTVNGTEAVQTGTTDFRPILAKVQGTDSDCLYFGGNALEAGLLKMQMHELGMDNILYFGISGLHTSDTIKAAGDNASAEGMFCSDAAIDPSLTEVGKHYLELYESKNFDVPNEAWTVYAYDAALAIITAMKSIDGVPTAEQMRQTIAKVEFDGALGHTTFDDKGQTTNIANYAYFIIQDGEWVPLDTSKYGTGELKLPGKSE